MGHGSSLLGLLIGLFIGLPWTSSAAARAPDPPPAPPPPLAALAVDGAASLRLLRVDIRCEDLREERPAASCRVRTRFELVAVDAVELNDVRLQVSASVRFESRPAPRDSSDEHVWLDGEPLLEPRLLEAGEGVQVELTTTRELRAEAARTGGGWFMPAMRLRHLFFGGGPEPHLEAVPFTGRLVVGDALEIEGPVRASLSAPEFVSASVDDAPVGQATAIEAGALALHVGLELPWHPPALLQPGGPLLALGARLHLDDTEGDPRFLLRVGYELGFARHFFASATLESDFESLLESLVVEAATPMLFVLPGPSVGVGVVARQLGPGRADAGLRLRVGLQMPVLGVVVDFDYWPAQQTWTGTLAARFSL